MLYLLLILIIIACVLLVMIILAQNPKGGSLSGTFGNTATQVLGARQSADFLEKATRWLGLGIFGVVMITYFLTSQPAGAKSEARAKVSNALDYDVSGGAPVGKGPISLPQQQPVKTAPVPGK